MVFFIPFSFICIKKKEIIWMWVLQTLDVGADGMTKFNNHGEEKAKERREWSDWLLSEAHP